MLKLQKTKDHKNSFPYNADKNYIWLLRNYAKRKWSEIFKVYWGGKQALKFNKPKLYILQR